MKLSSIRLALALLLMVAGAGHGPLIAQAAPAGASTPDLAGLARRGELRAATREVRELTDGARRGVRIGAAAGEHPAWVEGVSLETGTIEVELRGKDLMQQSFLGLAFAGVSDTTFEAVYLRPFNFRAADPVRRDHAVQYVSLPAYSWQRLRAERAEVFENPVIPPPDPNAWVTLRLAVEPTQVRVFVGEGAEPDLVVERLDVRPGTRVGLWVGNGSEGEFANLRVTAGNR